MTNVLLASWATSVALAILLWRYHCRLVLIARASHELRGPLCAAQLGLSTLPGASARVAAIDLELQRAGRALEDLSAARTGARAGSALYEVELADVVRRHASTWRMLAEANGASLELDLPALARRPLALAGPTGTLVAAPVVVPATTVLADPLRIAQAGANLVGNAAEHGGGVVRVAVRVVPGAVRFEVTDDGPGLPASLASLTAVARARRGHRGHGLAIVAAIARQHGGRLFTAPSAGGARLVFELPAAR